MLLLKCNWLCHSDAHIGEPASACFQQFNFTLSLVLRQLKILIEILQAIGVRAPSNLGGGAVTSLPEKHYITPENARVFKRTQIAGKTKNVHNSHVQWNCDHFKIDILKLSIFYDLDWQLGILGQKVRKNFKKAHCGTIQNTELFFGRATTKSSGLRLLWFFFLLLLLLMQIISWISTVRTWNHIWHNIT